MLFTTTGTWQIARAVYLFLRAVRHLHLVEFAMLADCSVLRTRCLTAALVVLLNQLLNARSGRSGYARVSRNCFNKS
jgi:hypothetical protein